MFQHETIHCKNDVHESVLHPSLCLMHPCIIQQRMTNVLANCWNVGQLAIMKQTKLKPRKHRNQCYLTNSKKLISVSKTLTHLDQFFPFCRSKGYCCSDRAQEKPKKVYTPSGVWTDLPGWILKPKLLMSWTACKVAWKHSCCASLMYWESSI